MNPTPTLYIVVPCYNEEEVLPETARRLSELMDSLISFGEVTPESRVLCGLPGVQSPHRLASQRARRQPEGRGKRPPHLLHKPADLGVEGVAEVQDGVAARFARGDIPL